MFRIIPHFRPLLGLIIGTLLHYEYSINFHKIFCYLSSRCFIMTTTWCFKRLISKKTATYKPFLHEKGPGMARQEEREKWRWQLKRILQKNFVSAYNICEWGPPDTFSSHKWAQGAKAKITAQQIFSERRNCYNIFVIQCRYFYYTKYMLLTWYCLGTGHVGWVSIDTSWKTFSWKVISWIKD